MIDVLVPWVNPNDTKWVSQYREYKYKEKGEKADCRFRDMGTFKYFFRGIEKNMPWVRYVFLLLASESQIPSWLNTKNPKLKIVYHRSFIPESELPTFNSSVINCYAPFIKELSNTYVLFNDDFFAVQPLSESDFFINDRPVNEYKVNYDRYGITYWHKNILNGYKILESQLGQATHYKPGHGPISFKKDLQLFIWNKFNFSIKRALANSRFRKETNVTDWMFFDAMVQLNLTDKRTVNINQYEYKPKFSIRNKIVCFNDTEALNADSYHLFKTNVNSYLQSVLSNKSSFEN